MKATTKIKTGNKEIVSWSFDTIKEAVEMAKHQVYYPFSSPVTDKFDKIEILVNIKSTGKNVFSKSLKK